MLSAVCADDFGENVVCGRVNGVQVEAIKMNEDEELIELTENQDKGIDLSGRKKMNSMESFKKSNDYQKAIYSENADEFCKNCSCLFIFEDKTRCYAYEQQLCNDKGIIFHPRSAELSYFLDSGYPVRLKFVNMKDIDKKRLSILYSTILKIITKVHIPEEDIEELYENKISFKKGDKK